MEPNNNHEEIKNLLVENQRLLIENNQLLRKMRKSAIIGFVFRIIYLVIFMGVPIFVYFNYIEPNLATIKTKLDNFEQLTAESDFFKKISDSLNSKSQE